MAVQEEDIAPDFTLKDHQDQAVTLSSYRGRTVILYFYPKDDTPGCTKEACSIRDQHPAIADRKAVVLGVSADPAERHQKFRSKYNLPFTLLSDPDHAISKLYGAWGTKNMYGKISEGQLRQTFIIDPEGRVKKIFKKVSTETHGQDLLTYI